MSRLINTELKSDSDSETESKSDIELMAKLEYFWCMQNLFVKKKTALITSFTLLLTHNKLNLKKHIFPLQKKKTNQPVECYLQKSEVHEL